MLSAHIALLLSAACVATAVANLQSLAPRSHADLLAKNKVCSDGTGMPNKFRIEDIQMWFSTNLSLATFNPLAVEPDKLTFVFRDISDYGDLEGSRNLTTFCIYEVSQYPNFGSQASDFYSCIDPTIYFDYKAPYDDGSSVMLTIQQNVYRTIDHAPFLCYSVQGFKSLSQTNFYQACIETTPQFSSHPVKGIECRVVPFSFDQEYEEAAPPSGSKFFLRSTRRAVRPRGFGTPNLYRSSARLKRAKSVKTGA